MYRFTSAQSRTSSMDVSREDDGQDVAVTSDKESSADLDEAPEQPTPQHILSPKRALLRRYLEDLTADSKGSDRPMSSNSLALVPYESSCGSSTTDHVAPNVSPHAALAGSLHKLSNDLLKRVFNLLSIKHFQLPLLATDRRTVEVLQPVFYQTIIINLSVKNAKNTVDALLSPSNKGLAFIEHVICTDPYKWAPSEKNRTNQLEIFMMLAKTLPENQLIRFEWPIEISLPPTYSLLLWERQRNLQNLEFWNGTWPQKGYFYLAMSQALRQINCAKELRICPHGPDGLESYLVLKNRDIKSLHLEFKLLKTQESMGEHDRRVPELLFRHLTPLNKLVSPKHQFQRLVLKNVDMYFCEETWLKAMDVSHLIELELHQCYYSDRFLRGLIKANSRIEKFTLCYDFSSLTEKRMSVDANLVLEEFLNTMPQGYLKILRLYLSGHRSLLDAKSIGRHAASLEELVLRIWAVQIRQGIMLDGESKLQLLEIEDILKGATTKLKKLALLLEDPKDSFTYPIDISGRLNHLYRCVKAITMHCVPDVLVITGFIDLVLPRDYDPEQNPDVAYEDLVNFHSYASRKAISQSLAQMILEDFAKKFFVLGRAPSKPLDISHSHKKTSRNCRLLVVGGHGEEKEMSFHENTHRPDYVRRDGFMEWEEEWDFVKSLSQYKNAKF